MDLFRFVKLQNIVQFRTIKNILLGKNIPSSFLFIGYPLLGIILLHFFSNTVILLAENFTNQIDIESIINKIAFTILFYLFLGGLSNNINRVITNNRFNYLYLFSKNTNDFYLAKVIDIFPFRIWLLSPTIGLVLIVLKYYSFKIIFTFILCLITTFCLRIIIIILTSLYTLGDNYQKIISFISIVLNLLFFIFLISKNSLTVSISILSVGLIEIALLISKLNSSYLILNKKNSIYKKTLFKFSNITILSILNKDLTIFIRRISFISIIKLNIFLFFSIFLLSLVGVSQLIFVVISLITIFSVYTTLDNEPEKMVDELFLFKTLQLGPNKILFFNIFSSLIKILLVLITTIFMNEFLCLFFIDNNYKTVYSILLASVILFIILYYSFFLTIIDWRKIDDISDKLVKSRRFISSILPGSIFIILTLVPVYGVFIKSSISLILIGLIYMYILVKRRKLYDE